MEIEDLGWLEADLDLHDDYLDEDIEIEPPLPDEDASIEEPIIKPNLLISDDRIIDSESEIEILQPKKRLLNPSLLDSSNVEDKRCRIDSSVNEDDDDDWMRYSPPPPEEAAVVVEVEEEKETFISRYATDIEGDFMPVTAPGGDRVYAKLIKEEEDDDKLKKLDVKGPIKGLMLEPISVLMQKVEQAELQKALEASVSSQIDADLLETPVVTERLWVDKYSPNSFVELLSDEHTNREVLMWLKQWDSSVFGTEVKSTADDVLSALKRHTSVSQHKKVSSNNFFGKNKEFVSNREYFGKQNHWGQKKYDFHAIQEPHNKKTKDSGPPEQKILLLCGAPGLGKTTLAHVAARHCGYRVVEINASDDRSASTIETKILDVVQMNSVMADSRPKCLVIDEIDGALGDGKGAVDVILKMVSADKKSDVSENIIQSEQQGKTSSKKKRKETPLLRPVICICNDLYAPALRPLRNVAMVHVFVQPTVNRIVNRLKYICNKEAMRTSSIALTALAEYTECDIRACLNTLQFLNKKKEMLNVLDISSQVIGRKDTSKSVFDIWKEIFQKRRLKGVRKSIDSCRSPFNEFTSLHTLISNCGSYDLILDGIHENILQLNYHDPVMEKTVKCLHNLEVSDILHQYVMRTQKMSLQAYQPAIAIAIHGVVSQVEKPNIQWPKSFHRYRTSLIDKVEALHTWHNKIPPCISRHISTKSFVADLVSPLLHILSPSTLRPAALHLLSEKDKNEMAQLVRTMVSYAITYRPKKIDPLPGKLRNEASTDTQILSFDPPLGDFVNFEGYDSNFFILAPSVKQVLSHEVEKQRILQSSINKSKDGNESTYLSEKEKSSKPDCAPDNTKTSISNLKSSSAPNRCTSTPANTIVSATASGRSATSSIEISKPSETTKKRSGGSFNFFERFRKTSANGSQMTETVKKVPATLERDSRPVLFKFNEGFTNAVKRPIRMREFLM